jgi:putative acetyltransferase
VPTIRPAFTPSDWEVARALFREYERELDAPCCFDGREAELAELDRRYCVPRGRLLLASGDAGEPVGCAAFCWIEDGIVEGRRLYLRPPARGHGLGGALVRAILDEAVAAGARAFRIETLAGKRPAAVEKYRALGFREIAPYGRRPVEGALHLELALPAT